MDDNTADIKAMSLFPRESLVTDQLCLVCMKINFQALLDDLCLKKGQQKGSSNSLGSCDDNRLGTLERISTAGSCPACRLISNCISVYSNWLSPALEIRLAVEHIMPDSERRLAGEVTHNVRGPMISCITVQVCKKAVKSKPGSGLAADGPREHFPTGVGVILPVSPRHNEEYIGFEIAHGGPTSERSSKIPRYTYARPVTPLINTGLIKRWIARCIGEHHKCCDVGFITSSPRANIRLIDVKKKKVVLRDRNCKYVALSYVWGPNTKGLLTRSTMEKYSLEGSLDQEDVPLTIRDTINLVDDLGKRYLWIDSLCIIQDDLADKREYLPMMGDIYNAAMFVIMAAVENAHSGLPGSGNHKRQFPRMTERIRGIDFTIGQPQLREHLATTTWNLRGWTYQEANLARRALVITNFQVYWSCREESWCEDRFTEFPKPINFPLKYNSLFDTTVSPYPSYSLELGLVIDLCPLGKYCRMARELSSRSFSDPRDCLWALLGILKSLLPKFPQGYIWAMPKSKLDAALLWETDHVRHLSHAFAIPTGKGEWRKMEIPSWCWIGKGTEIWYDGCYESIESMVRWHEPVNFGELGPLNGSQEEEEEEERARNLQSVISQPGHVSPGGAVFDFALLRFTTELASLKMHTLVSKPPKESGCPIIGSATISLLSGRNIGTMRVPIEAFSQKSEIRGDFILLSAMPRETGPATQQCEEPTYNVMLVNWSHDKRFASRISWTEVKKSAWEECERQRKTITLK